MSCDVVLTRSGVPAMRDRASGEIMHPGAGPAVESSELYAVPSRLSARLLLPREEPLVLFDAGLGAASNALAAWRVSESLPAGARRLEIVSFENDLSALELALRPEHSESFGLRDLRERVPCESPGLERADSNTHAAATALLENGRYETARTTWRLSRGDFRVRIAEEPAASADIVFWDFYSSKTAPDLWNVAAFRALRRVCREGTTVHTYSTATSARSAMLLAELAVGVGPRSGDRPETTIAATSAQDLEQPLDARWLARLARSTAAFPSDAPEDALARVRAHPQFAGLLSIAAIALGVLACASPASVAPPPPRDTTSAAAVPVPKSAPSSDTAAPREPAVATASPSPAAAPATETKQRPPPIPIRKGTRVLMFGDSMVWSGLGDHLNTKVVAAEGTLMRFSKPNATTLTWSEGRELQDLLAKWRPDVVIVALTSNELFVPNPGARTREIRRIVEVIGSRKCVWIGPSPWLPEKGILGVLRENAGPCRYFDSTGLVLERQPDRIHPTHQGGKAWADAVWQEVFAE